VLILDEPTVGLDPKQIIEIRNLIRSFGGKSTVILSTHILHEIEKVCDRILIIDQGQILAFDTIENLSEKLSGSYTLYMTVGGPTEKTKSALRNIDGIVRLQDLGKLEDGVYRYQMQIPKDLGVRKAISAKMSENDFKIIEMCVEKMSAEEIFRKIVPDNERVSDAKNGDSEKTLKEESKS
jgi:ABC-2 type transport system ATP-binding protein